MSDAAVILKLNLPPKAQYAQGDSLIIQADTAEEVAEHLDAIVGAQGPGLTILTHIVEQALGGAAAGALSRSGGGGGTDPSPASPAPSATPDDDPPASKGQLAVLAKARGVAINDLGNLTKAEAAAAIKAEKGR